MILNERGELISGQLCFPAGWSLDEKFGKNMMAIHAPLPGRLNPMIQAASKLMERIPNGHPVQRSNWGIRVCDELDLSPKHTQHYRELLSQSEDWDEKTIGEKLFIRIEYQTLSRLPQSNCILFTIRTYLGKVSDEIRDRERTKRFLNYLVSVPPDVLEYKLISSFSEKLIRYLQMHQTIL
jgi:dimethylamine monooxygenase subunit A